MPPIRHYIGLNEYHFRQKKSNIPVYYEPASLINAHMLLCGMSGTGKSYQTKRFLESAARAGVEIDIFDVHEELDGVYGAVACKYSQATGFGYNPLVLDPDIHSGGVETQVNMLVGLVRDATPQFGAKQEAVLRYLLTDVYAASGIFQSSPKTWARREMTEQHREALIAAKNWQGLRDFYPTMEDLKSYAKRKLVSLTIGGDNKAITAFENLRRTKNRLYQARSKFGRAVSPDEIERLEKQIEDLKEKSIEAFKVFVEEMQTGREIDDIMKYDSVDVLTSVLQRLDILMSAGGLFRSNPPPFGNANVRCHQLKSISTPQQVLFVKLRLRAIFEKCKKMGATASGTEVRHIVFLDEAHKYFTEDSDDIINVIAKEGRKFGLGLWCASQEPTAFPVSFLTNVGATVLLGIHSSFWKAMTAKMRITEEQLKYIKAKEVIAIKMMKDGSADPPFSNVIVPNPSNDGGREAGKFS